MGESTLRLWLPQDGETKEDAYKIPVQFEGIRSLSLWEIDVERHAAVFVAKRREKINTEDGASFDVAACLDDGPTRTVYVVASNKLQFRGHVPAAIQDADWRALHE